MQQSIEINWEPRSNFHKIRPFSGWILNRIHFRKHSIGTEIYEITSEKISHRLRWPDWERISTPPRSKNHILLNFGHFRAKNVRRNLAVDCRSSTREILGKNGLYLRFLAICRSYRTNITYHFTILWRRAASNLHNFEEGASI